MNVYRSRETHLAVQYQGEPIEGVTCSGQDRDFETNGCDSSRRSVPHVHTSVAGGMSCLKVGDWIMPVKGGPFCVASDALFRAHWEVPDVVVEPVGAAVDPAPAVEPVPVPEAVGPVAFVPGDASFETKTYADGTVASGQGPLPEVSPNGAPEIGVTLESVTDPFTAGGMIPSILPSSKTQPTTEK